MSESIASENLELETRKQQATELGINISEDMTLSCIEDEIATQLEIGMQNLKDIVNEIHLPDSEI